MVVNEVRPLSPQTPWIGSKLRKPLHCTQPIFNGKRRMAQNHIQGAILAQENWQHFLTLVPLDSELLWASDCCIATIPSSF